MSDTKLINSIELVYVSDGTQFAPTMSVTGSAAQSYTEDGGYFPDWAENAGARPTFTPMVYDAVQYTVTPMPWQYGSNPNALRSEDGNYYQLWTYNDERIVWEQVGSTSQWKSSNGRLAGLFSLDWSNPAAPVVTIIGNIPSSLSENDNDYIAFKGFISVGKSSFPAVIGHDIRINVLSGGSQFSVEVNLANGTAFDGDSETNDALYVDAIALLNATGVFADDNHVAGTEAAGKHSGIYNIRSAENGRYAIDISQSVGLERYYYSSADNAAAVNISSSPRPTGGFFIKADDVGGECILVFQLVDTQENTVLAAVSEKIVDLGDPDVVTFKVTASKNGEERETQRDIHPGESVKVEVRVTTRDGLTDRTDKYTFSDLAVLSNGESVPLADVLTVQFAQNPDTGVGSFTTSHEKINPYGALLFTIKAQRK